MGRVWKVLVVDDDPDIHNITELALKRRLYRGRGFRLVHATSAAQARDILTSPEGSTFHVALVDIIMETEHAGLDLCEFIRKHMSDSLRVIVRTGQIGTPSQEAVMEAYDIDTLAKGVLTDDLLYTALCAACRSSLDVSTATANANQLRDYIDALRSPTTGVPELAKIMRTAFEFLESKHGVQLTLLDLDDPSHAEAADLARVRSAVTQAIALGTGPIADGQACGLPAEEFLVLVTGLVITPEPRTKGSIRDRVARWLTGSKPERDLETVTWAIHVCPADSSLREKQRADLVRDLEHFMEGWRIATAMLAMREQVVQQRLAAAMTEFMT
jgi:CheY-like chemotaxis protein